MYRDNFILVPTYILSIFAWVLEKRRVKALNAHRVSKKLDFRVLKNMALYPPKKDFKSFTMNYYSPLTRKLSVSLGCQYLFQEERDIFQDVHYIS